MFWPPLGGFILQSLQVDSEGELEVESWGNFLHNSYRENIYMFIPYEGPNSGN